MPIVLTQEQYYTAVQGDFDIVKTSYQTSGNPDLDAKIENQVSLSKQPSIEYQTQITQSQD